MPRLIALVLLAALMGAGLAACAQLEPPPAPPGPNGDASPSEPERPDPDPTDPGAESPPPGTSRVAVHSDGTPADAESGQIAIDHDGRFVAFVSVASNLVEGADNGVADVYVRDRVAGTTERVSVAPDGDAANGPSERPSISADGRIVAFTSAASDLVEGDGNEVSDVFVRDREQGTTERVSVTSDGREADGASRDASVSLDGRYVFFRSVATNLGGDGSGSFLHDRGTGTTVALPEPALAAAVFPGRFHATSATQFFEEGEVHDRVTGRTEPVDLTPGTEPPNSDTSPGPLTPDGRYLAVQSLANNLVAGPEHGWKGWNAFLHDRETGTTELVSVGTEGEPGDAFSFGPVPSADGRHVVFASLAKNLVPGETHIGWSLFVRDRDAGTTRRVPVDSGQEPNPDFSEYAISGDGRHVAFTYVATFEREGDVVGVEGVDRHPDDVVEVFVHTFD